jgi:hypothetical protein
MAIFFLRSKLYHGVEEGSLLGYSTILVLLKYTDVSEVCTASIIRAMNDDDYEDERQYAPL